MKSESKPEALGWLVALVYLAAVLWALAAGAACAHRASPDEEQYINTSPIDWRSVRIQTNCGAGSGVLVGGSLVITAHHVIDCDRSEEGIRLAKIVNVMVEGRQLGATYDALDPARDLARLRLPLDLPYSGVAMTRAVFGETLCALTATPERETKCGVFYKHELPHLGNIVLDDVDFWLGNSGSPVYNIDGKLVGVVTRMQWCSNEDAAEWAMTGDRVTTCDGFVSEIVRSPVLP